LGCGWVCFLHNASDMFQNFSARPYYSELISVPFRSSIFEQNKLLVCCDEQFFLGGKVKMIEHGPESHHGYINIWLNN